MIKTGQALAAARCWWVTCPPHAEALAHAIHLNTEDATAHYNQAMVQAKLDQQSAARAFLRCALALPPQWQAHVEQDAFLQTLL